MSRSMRPFVIGELDLDAIAKPVLAGYHHDVVVVEATLDLDLRSAHGTHLHTLRVHTLLIGEVDENDGSALRVANNRLAWQSENIDLSFAFDARLRHHTQAESVLWIGYANSRHVGARGRLGCNINDANHTPKRLLGERRYRHPRRLPQTYRV